MLQVADDLGIRETFKFYQDNNLKFKSRIVSQYLLHNCPKVLHPPLQSSDLNPIENLWDELDSKIRKTPIHSKKLIKNATDRGMKFD